MAELRPAFPLADARNAIVEAAIAVFAEFGFHGATMREIAARAGVSQALLHHHFGNKEALWHLVGERMSADFLAYVGDVIAPEKLGPETFPRALRTYLAYWREHPAAFRFNLWRLLEGPAGERQSRSVALTTRSVPVIQQAQAAGIVRDDMPAGLALCVAGALVQFWLHSQTEIRDSLAATGDAPLDDDAFLDHVLHLLRPPARQRRPARRSPPKRPRK